MNEYNLKEGDIIKIGRIAIRIKSIKFKKNSKNSTDLGGKNNSKEIKIEKNIIKKKSSNAPQQIKTCRICYLEEETSDNPLVCPCICSGSMKYIHLKCLKKWINTSVFILMENSQFCNIYQYREAKCELCKTEFPEYIMHKGEKFEIFDFYNDFNNCLILESLTMDRNKNKYLYITNLDVENNKINIGRGHDSNVVLNDISVSRVHSILHINKNNKKISISDNNSKFGTLILVQAKNIILGLDLKLHIQIGRSYLEFLLKGSSNFFGCFEIGEKKNPDFYFLQNKCLIQPKHELSLKNDSEKDFGDKFNDDENNIKKNDDETIIKYNEYDNLNTNKNIYLDNLEEILLTSIKSKRDDEKKDLDEKDKKIKEKEEECIVINDSEDEIENKSNKDINNKKENKIKENIYASNGNIIHP